jgi:type III secretion protein S
VLSSAIVGLLVSFMQAITSLQDQSISQGAKMIVVTIVIVVAAPWGASIIFRFAETILKVAIQ